MSAAEAAVLMPTNPETAPVLLDTSAVIAHMIGHAKISQRIKAEGNAFSQTR